MANSIRILLLLVFMLPQVCETTLANDGEHPNVLLIITDEHNFRTLGCYRKTMLREQAEMWGRTAVVSTPNMDRLADEGVLCTRAYATSPVCSPCRAAMITGRYPHAAGVSANNQVLNRSIPTLADRLNDAGYRSSFIGKWHLGGNGKPEWAPRIDGGFQHKRFMFNRGHWKKFAIRDGNPIVAAQKNGKPTYAVDGADHESFATDWLTNRAIEFMTESDSTKPFFAVVSYPDPHGPNTVRQPYDKQFKDLPIVAPRTYRKGNTPPKWLGGTRKHPVFRGADMASYFGMVKCLDDNIGRMLKRLDKAGQLKQTLVIMTSDHGDLCYEHDRLNKGNPYEGSARVPLIFRFPGRIKPEQFYSLPVGTVDLTPTTIGLLGLPGNAEDQGRDLSGQLQDVSRPLPKGGRPPVTFLRNAGNAAGWIAAVDYRYKLILSVNDTPWLFDARDDPDELKNSISIPEKQPIVTRLANELQRYGRQSKDPHLKNPAIAKSLKALLEKKSQRLPKRTEIDRFE